MLREIIAGDDCGLLVDSLISEAIGTLVSSLDLAQRVGDNGRPAVEQQYKWQIEELKLPAFEESTLSHSPR